MINLLEYSRYSKNAMILFEYMNGKINKLNNKCEFSIEPLDHTEKYGDIKFPNTIKLYIGNIMNDWNDDWWSFTTKDIYVNSVIAWTIAHELAHAEQYISIIDYNVDIDYKNKVESYVQRFSHDWVAYHQEEINNLFGIEIRMENIKAAHLPKVGFYTQITPRGFYRKTIENIILRDRNQFELIKCLNEESDNYYSMACHFRRDDIGTKGVMIKNNRQYIGENIPMFTDLLRMYIGNCNDSTYTVVVSMKRYESTVPGEKHCDLIFSFTNVYTNAFTFNR